MPAVILAALVEEATPTKPAVLTAPIARERADVALCCRPAIHRLGLAGSVLGLPCLISAFAAEDQRAGPVLVGAAGRLLGARAAHLGHRRRAVGILGVDLHRAVAPPGDRADHRQYRSY